MISNPHNRIANSQRGFTLLIAIILASVCLAVGLALADIAYKQVVLSSTARHSQVAFYRADSAMECALYYDQQFGWFNPNEFPAPSTFPIQCQGQTITVTKTALSGGRIRSTFDVPCSGGGRAATVEVYKETGAGTCAPGRKNCLYTNGFNTCSTTDPNRFERGLRVTY